MKTLRAPLLFCLLPLALAANPAVEATAHREAAAFRKDLATAVKTETIEPGAALARLRAHPNPNGPRREVDVDFAYAALDIGLRLVPMDPAKAERFLRAAEQELGRVVARLPDSDAAAKARHLGTLAIIRANYLQDRAQARADIVRARQLQPQDKYLERLERETNGVGAGP